MSMGTIRIPLTQGQFATVDEEDYPKVAGYKWHYHKGKNDHTGYAITNTRVNGKIITLLLHRLILNAPEGLGVDHQDGDGCNNVRANMRLASERQNQRNQRPRIGGSSKYKGVSWHKRDKKWTAQINHNYKGIYIGYYHSEEDAARAYDAKAITLFGEFARLNFPTNQVAQETKPEAL